MEPMRVFLGKQFERASDSWESKELGRVAQALACGEVYHRRYRVTEVALGEDDRAFALQLHMLSSHHQLWSTAPARWHTMRNRALSFRCLSRMGCGFEYLLASRHRRCPFQTFLMIPDPTQAQRIIDCGDCLHDDWTRALLKLYPTLEGEEVREVVSAVASILKVDISSLETKHASIRRLLTSRSVQTHAISLSDLSGQWVLQRIRAAHNTFAGCPKKPRRKRQTTRVKKTRKRGRGRRSQEKTRRSKKKRWERRRLEGMG